VLSSGVRKDDTDLSPFGGLRGGRNVPHQRIMKGGPMMPYYQVMAGTRAVVDVCTSRREAVRSCQHHRRVLGGSFRVEETEDPVSEKWK